MPAEHSNPITSRQRVGWAVVHPHYRQRFARWGLTKAGDFLDLPGEVVSGHPDRHVVRVVVGRGACQIAAYLKREHRVPWRDRVANAFAGFGWVSKSEREARLLRQLGQVRIPVPKWLAYGEDGQGRAFVLVRAVPAALDLRTYLFRTFNSKCRQRRRRLALARGIGRLLARVHAAGFNCPDLSSKHVLVRLRRRTLVLIDWPRARRWPVVARADCVRDLAALHASVGDNLASPRERLACLREYLLFLKRGQTVTARDLKDLALAVQRRSAQLLARRSMRELRQPPIAAAAQRLRWIEGETLCVVRGFWRRCKARIPAWLAFAARESAAHTRESVIDDDGRRLILRQSPRSGRLQRILAWFRGRRVTCEALRHAGRVFRLERFGVSGPRLLAFGQRPDGAGFVLLQPRAEVVPLADWLGTVHHDRLRLLESVGAMLRRIHDAGFRLIDVTAMQVRCRRLALSPVLADVTALQECRHASGRRDLNRHLDELGLSGHDATAVVRGYGVDGSDKMQRKVPRQRRSRLAPSPPSAHTGGRASDA